MAERLRFSFSKRCVHRRTPEARAGSWRIPQLFLCCKQTLHASVFSGESSKNRHSAGQGASSPWRKGQFWAECPKSGVILWLSPLFLPGFWASCPKHALHYGLLGLRPLGLCLNAPGRARPARRAACFAQSGKRSCGQRPTATPGAGLGRRQPRLGGFFASDRFPGEPTSRPQSADRLVVNSASK